jgi:energy-coupling factor transporter ATP-binding protein EcfA2
MKLFETVPDLVEFIEWKSSENGEAYDVWVNSEGEYGFTFAIKKFDSEKAGLEGSFQQLSNWIKTLDTGLRVKFHSRSRAEIEEREHARAAAINELGSLRHDLLISFEWGEAAVSARTIKQFVKTLAPWRAKSSISQADIKKLWEKIDLRGLALCGFQPRAATKAEIASLFPLTLAEMTENRRTGIDVGFARAAIVRLWKPGIVSLPADALASVVASFSDELDIVVSLQRKSEATTSTFLARKVKQQGDPTSFVSATKKAEAEAVQEETELAGGSLVEMEWVAILYRHSEERLRADSLLLAKILHPFGDVYVETDGAAASYIASHPGRPAHFKFLCRTVNVPYYLPIATAGVSPMEWEKTPVPLHGFALSRRDLSTDFIDFWQSENPSYGAIAVGPPGSGKSVWLTHLTRALHSSERMKIIKIDVKGSALRECEELGGVYHPMGLNCGANVNPLEILIEQQIASADRIALVVDFLGALCLVDDEKRLPTAVKAKLEQLVVAYKSKLEALGEKGLFPSLLQFVEFSNDLPRREIFERWLPGGKYAAILNDVKVDPKKKKKTKCDVALSSNADVRYHYYNFESLQDAGDVDLARVSVALVMSEILLITLKIKPESGERLAIICDEARFFFRSCQQFFLSTIKNVRKLGQSVVLVSQNSGDFLIDENAGADRLSVFTDIPTHILFSDGKKDEQSIGILSGRDDPTSFVNRHGLSERECALYLGLERNPPEYVEFFVKDPRGSRVMRFRQTPDEYWLTTTDPNDRTRFERLRKDYPELTTMEVVRVCGILDRKAKMGA